MKTGLYLSPTIVSNFGGVSSEMTMNNFQTGYEAAKGAVQNDNGKRKLAQCASNPYYYYYCYFKIHLHWTKVHPNEPNLLHNN